VTVATPMPCLPIVAAMAPELMTAALPGDAAGVIQSSAIDVVSSLAQDVVVCGPGLGRTPDVAAFLRELLARGTAPLVLDADALTMLAGEPAALTGSEERTVIITPHPGEMARLTGMSVADVQANRIDIAVSFASTHRLYVVLKGHRTIVATPDGKASINPTGNPGMATGGTGDVLAGMIGSWLAQLLDAEAACQLAVFLHGMAGDLAEAECGQTAMTATDLLDRLGAALRRLQADPAAGAAEE
jgi:NAD(P)H-hydrate epimerase